MSFVRLESVAPDLTQAVQAADAGARRAAAVRAAEIAVEMSGLENATVGEVLARLRGTDGVDVASRTALVSAVAYLDEAQWDLQDLVDEGKAAPAEHLVAFRRARAASAVAFASDPDPLVAALEGIYEASAAVEDPEPLFSTVSSLLI